MAPGKNHLPAKSPVFCKSLPVTLRSHETTGRCPPWRSASEEAEVSFLRKDVSFLRKQESRCLVPPKSPLYVIPANLYVIPAKAGIQSFFLGSCLRRNDTCPLSRFGVRQTGLSTARGETECFSRLNWYLSQKRFIILALRDLGETLTDKRIACWMPLRMTHATKPFSECPN